MSFSHLNKADRKHNLIFEIDRKYQIILLSLAFLLSLITYLWTWGHPHHRMVNQQDRGGIIPEQQGIKSRTQSLARCRLACENGKNPIWNRNQSFTHLEDTWMGSMAE